MKTIRVGDLREALKGLPADMPIGTSMDRGGGVSALAVAKIETYESQKILVLETDGHEGPLAGYDDDGFEINPSNVQMLLSFGR